MVNSVSGTPTGGNVAATTPLTKSDLSNPGAYYSDLNADILPIQPERKRKSFLGFLTGLVIKAAILGGAAVAARKYIPALKGDLASFDKTKLVGKAKFYFAKCADYISENAVKAYTYVKGLVKDAKAKADATVQTEEAQLQPKGPKGKVKPKEAPEA